MTTDPTRSPTSTAAGILRPDQLAQHVRLERVPCGDELGRLVTTPSDDYHQRLGVIAVMLADRSLLRVTQRRDPGA